MPPRLAAIYARVSTAEQSESGYSLPTQVEACLRHAVELGYEVPEAYIFQEDYPGASIRRSELTGIRVRRDNWVSVRYAEELNSGKSSVTPQRTDRHGILGEKLTDLQVSL